ncbi:MAG: metallophosphoesterase, partial [Calditrichaceae bacterium]
MKRLIIFLMMSTALFAQETDTLYILQTTDVHGNIYPYDYFRDEPDENRGLAKIFTKVTEYRKKHPNVLLVDGGDLLQGTPMIYYFNKIETDVPNPMIFTMNYMGYDAFAVGNHDIEQGLFTYHRAQDQSDFPWLSANSLMPDGRTYFDPYTIIEYNGITIGIIGLTTPGIPMWLDKTLYPGITWTDMIETARDYAEMLRPEVDVLVGLFHAGLNEDYSGAHTDDLGLPNENASRLVAEQVPLFDVVFAGHSHQDEVNVESQEAGS